MCTDLFENKELYNNKISELLLDLAFDRVVNVRISLAKFMKKVLKKEKNQWLKNDDTIKKILTKLRKDKSNEVLSYIKDINDVTDLECDIQNVNEKFQDKMNFISEEFGITKNVPLKSVFRSANNVTNETPAVETPNNQ